VTSPAFEAFLARIYVDAEARARFVADPESTARAAGLNESECTALESIDLTGLEMAAVSFERKRARQPHGRFGALRAFWGR
jgi:hypothetical protein